MTMNICNSALNFLKPKELFRSNNSHKRQAKKKIKIKWTDVYLLIIQHEKINSLSLHCPI